MLAAVDILQPVCGVAPEQRQGDATLGPCLLRTHGSPGRFLLKSLFEKGLVEERPNFGLKHVGRRYGDYLIRFYQEL